jgi:hypothetical protein
MTEKEYEEIRRKDREAHFDAACDATKERYDKSGDCYRKFEEWRVESDRIYREKCIVYYEENKEQIKAERDAFFARVREDRQRRRDAIKSYDPTIVTGTS